MTKIPGLSLIFWGACIVSSVAAQSIGYMPEETAPHEGTWLQWPHHYTYGTQFRNQVQPTWLAMTKVLVQSEKVHIIVYNTTEKTRVRNLLIDNGIALNHIDFLVRKTNDFWVRDNGPIFVFNESLELAVSDWGFNGWGYDAPYALDDTVPIGVANLLGMERVALNDWILEGGAIEVDATGVLLATRSSILEPMRNAGVTQSEMDQCLKNNLGVRKIIWLDGANGGQDDITDMHIDGFARFGMPGTLVTMNESDLAFWGLSLRDVNRLYAATDAHGQPYNMVKLPLTKYNVKTSYGYNIGFKGSYVNFYVSNKHVLMPTYNDPHDAIAKTLLQAAFPDRTVVGIDCRNVYRWGGMIHCITQQQPKP
jgi:agmatine deiminase